MMKTVSSFPILDLAKIDAAIFNLDEVTLKTEPTPGSTSGEYGKGTVFSLLALLHELKKWHVPMALVTATKNCTGWFQTPALAEWFDQLVEREPEGYLKAAQLLKVSPERAAIVETTPPGGRSGGIGNFRMIVGFNQTTLAVVPTIKGAEVVVGDLSELSIRLRNGLVKRNTVSLPLGLEQSPDIIRKIHGKSIVVFLDYDGTLTPIVDRPELAILSEQTRDTLRQLAQHCTVGVISGRDRVMVQQLVNVESLIYAGSHGFDISGPENWNIQNQLGEQFLPLLDQVEAALHEQLSTIVGILIERKKYSVAVHYRLVKPQDLASVHQAVEEMLSSHPDIRSVEGKKIYDLQPRIDWDKGKAISWLMQALNISQEQTIPFFLGDDLTDEDAFRTLQAGGIGIIVADTPRFTYATYRLKNPQEVDQFLRLLTDSIMSPLA